MKIELNLPDIEGYEPAEGAQPRYPKTGDSFLVVDGSTEVQLATFNYESLKAIILKKKEPKYHTQISSIYHKGTLKMVELKALEDAIAIIDSHYNWSADLRAATLELKELIK